MLRKRIPTRYRSVSAHRGDTIKISTGTADRYEAARRLPDVLRKWSELEAEWERKLNVVALTPERAAEITALWAAWIAGGAPINKAGLTAATFEPGARSFKRETDAAARAQIEAHMDEALTLANLSITPETRPVLVKAMDYVVWAAYQQAELRVERAAEAARFEDPLELARIHLLSIGVEY